MNSVDTYEVEAPESMSSKTGCLFMVPCSCMSFRGCDRLCSVKLHELRFSDVVCGGDGGGDSEFVGSVDFGGAVVAMFVDERVSLLRSVLLDFCVEAGLGVIDVRGSMGSLVRWWW